MNCRECTEFILRYLEGELPADEAAAFEVHMDRCPPCLRYLAQYKLTISAGKAACRDAGQVPEELIRAILSSRHGN